MQSKIEYLKQWLGTGSINIFGKPLSGKDTQSKAISDLFDATMISGGEILRSDLTSGSVKNIINRGELLPSKDYIKIVLPHINNPKLKNKALILSSVGRWIGEENKLVKALKSNGHPLKAVVYLKLSDDEVKTRIKVAKNIGHRLNRADDTLEKLKIRLTEYQQKTMPVIDFYKNSGVLIEVDGALPQKEVTKNIIDSLYKLSQ